MEAKGKILDIARDWKTGNTRIYLEINGDYREEAERLKDDYISAKIIRHREKRSLDANAYYWVLAGKLARALKVTNAAMHNILIRRYGACEIVDGKMIYLVLPDTDEAENRVLEAETYHIRPTTEVKTGKDGNYRTYVMMRGSSAYNTAEMARLIEGTVSECKEIGIETLTPDELERMMIAYEKRRMERTSRV